MSVTDQIFSPIFYLVEKKWKNESNTTSKTSTCYITSLLLRDQAKIFFGGDEKDIFLSNLI